MRSALALAIALPLGLGALGACGGDSGDTRVEFDTMTSPDTTAQDTGSPPDTDGSDTDDDIKQPPDVAVDVAEDTAQDVVDVTTADTTDAAVADTADADDAADTVVVVTPIGQACADADACPGGLCLGVTDSKDGVCVMPCAADNPCAEDSDRFCAAFPYDGATVDICLTADELTGLPCADGETTGDACPGDGFSCVPVTSSGGDTGDLGSFCAAACGDGDSCPSGTNCDDGMCIPEEGFSCSDLFAISDASATCAVANTFGSCGGVGSCGPNAAGDGLAFLCDADIPAAEVCDGMDNNCNDLKDEDLCDDRNPCTVDTCNEDGSCNFDAQIGQECNDSDPCTTSDQCQSDGRCDGTQGACACDAASECEVPSSKHADCVALSCDGDPAACYVTAINVGMACGGGSACLDSGTCNAFGECVGDASTCDDGNSCTTDSCGDDGECVFEPVAIGTDCEDGNACTTGDICKFDGTCGAGDPVVCDDTNGCTDDYCNAVTGCIFEDNTDACEDGEVCTINDVCDGGECVGTFTDCTGLSDQCNLGTCTPTGCVAEPKDSLCDDGDPCTSNTICVSGQCEGDTLDCSHLDTPCASGFCIQGICNAPDVTCSFVLGTITTQTASFNYSPSGEGYRLVCTAGTGQPAALLAPASGSGFSVRLGTVPHAAAPGGGP